MFAVKNKENTLTFCKHRNSSSFVHSQMQLNSTVNQSQVKPHTTAQFHMYFEMIPLHNRRIKLQNWFYTIAAKTRHLFPSSFFKIPENI